MISSIDIDNEIVVYPKPRLKDTRPLMDRVSGFDSEAYISGRPFMFCTSGGWITDNNSLKETSPEILLPRDIPEVFFESRYHNVNFMTYNLKYDAGAILHFLNAEFLDELRIKNFTWYNDIRITYIPHKMLEFKRKKIIVRFWDIAQFYKMSLNKAANKYLNKSKIDLRTKKFSENYVIRYFHSIACYCIQDAVLAKELGIYLLNTLQSFNITASTIYSCASIAFKYFCSKSRFCTMYDLWRTEKEFFRIVCDSYEGGKFEVTARGKFYGYEYDITSAYPYEIRNLVDISNSKVYYSKKYDPNAVYGFLRCRIHNPEGKYLPCGPMLKKSGRNVIRIYPAGTYYLTITKNEYDYLKSIGIEVDILKAAWLHVKRKRYIYRDVIDELFSLKNLYKNSDPMLYSVTKILMNSMYGKMCQCTEKYTGNVFLGSGFNAVHASVITANTRIKIADIQNRLGSDCLAVHTDSVMTTIPIPSNLVTGNLGEFEFVTEGDGILIACGMYQLGEVCAWKGMSPRPGDSWKKILSRFYHRSRIPYSLVRVESWREAMSRNHPITSINVFEKTQKHIDLNCDTKRRWPSNVKSRDLLSDIQHSIPRMIVENKPPIHWNL